MDKPLSTATRFLFRPGILNVLEHGITRASDAATSLVLIWVLPVETYGRLAYAQALIGPIVFLFVSQDIYIYRNYSRWKQSGRSTLLRAYSLMDRTVTLKAVLAIWISVILAWTQSRAGNASFGIFFAIFIWAFASVLLIHWIGPSREFLRLGGKLIELNRITLFQKLTIFLGVLICTRLFPHQIIWLAPLWIGSILVAKLALAFQVKKLAQSVSPTEPAGSSCDDITLKDAFFGVAIWNHLSGSVYLFAQTMDLFFLGVFKGEDRMISLYSVALKYSTFFTFLPFALANTFTVQLGNAPAGGDGLIEHRQLYRRSYPRFWLITTFQALFFLGMAPYLFEWSNRGKWNADEVESLTYWFRVLVLGSFLNAVPLLWMALSTMRTSIRSIALEIYVPWGLVCLVAYAWAGSLRRPDLLAQMNVVTAIAFTGLIFLHRRRNDRGF